MGQELNSVRVLLVDDSERMRVILSALLEAAGVQKIKEAADGETALELCRTWRPDLAVIDYHMQPMDGVAFTREVRLSRTSTNPFLPIVMLTAYTTAAHVRLARDAGVTEILVKPANAANLLDRVYSALLKPRPFIRASDYFGPDRRRRNIPDYAGPFRRSTDTAAAQSQPPPAGEQPSVRRPLVARIDGRRLGA